MNFSVISCKISSLRVFFFVGVTGLLSNTYSCFVGGHKVGIHFLHFTKSHFELCFWGELFPSLILLPIIPFGAVHLCS
jgi:hypothetical protein